MNTSDDIDIPRRRRRTHSEEFKAKVVSACRKPGVSIAAVALAHRLNANLLRRWVVAEEQAERAKPAKKQGTLTAPPIRASVERAFIPIAMGNAVVTTAQEITIELRRGATVVKVGWPLTAAAECAAWLRELLR